MRGTKAGWIESSKLPESWLRSLLMKRTQHKKKTLKMILFNEFIRRRSFGGLWIMRCWTSGQYLHFLLLILSAQFCFWPLSDLLGSQSTLHSVELRVVHPEDSRQGVQITILRILSTTPCCSNRDFYCVGQPSVYISSVPRPLCRDIRWVFIKDSRRRNDWILCEGINSYTLRLFNSLSYRNLPFSWL